MNHRVGQFRAELFDELVGRLLKAVYPEAVIMQRYALRVPHNARFRSVSIDFRLKLPSGDVIVETKAPYIEPVVGTMESAIRRFNTIVELLASDRIRTFILAIPTTVPESLQGTLREIQQKAEAQSAVVVVWDESALLQLVRQHLALDLTSFSLDELKRVLRPASTVDLVQLPAPGLHNNVVILMADFCSFTSFMNATRNFNAYGKSNGHQYVESIMGRFYRETRKAIYDHQGVVDKYIGDGVLAYWFGDNGANFELCFKRMMEIAVNLADEWQDEIDDSVEPTGLRGGCAIGDVLVVAEDSENFLRHVISHQINLASRLQGEAAPNSVVISNQLRKRFFTARDDFEKRRISLKGIGPVVAWQKTFGT